MLYGSETWTVKRGDAIRLQRNDARMARWMCNIRPENRIVAEGIRTRLELKNMKECLQDRKLQWFGHLERMEESARFDKGTTFKVSSSFPRGLLRKTWPEVFRIDLKGKSAKKEMVVHLS